MRKKKFSVIVTNFESSDHSLNLIQNLNGIRQKTGALIDLVIIDNHSSVDERQKLAGVLNDWVTVQFLDENIGYFSGLNKGVSTTDSEYDFWIVGNNDIEFSSDFFEILSATKFSDPVISPRITTMDGVEQNPHVIEAVSRKRELIYSLYYKQYYLAQFIKILSSILGRWMRRGDESRYREEGYIYQGYGALYILTPAYRQKYTQLPEDSFLLFEEFFLAKQLWKNNERVRYCPNLRVFHLCKGSTGMLASRLKWELGRKAFKKYRETITILNNSLYT